MMRLESVEFQAVNQFGQSESGAAGSEEDLEA